MLRELRVGNLALAQDLVLKFDSGLTMMTGETGAGKSLVAGALSLLAGGRADKGLIRKGEDLAWVEGVFELDDDPVAVNFLNDKGVRLGFDLVLVLRREVKREGRGRIHINGLLSSQSLLVEIGAFLFSIQSQDQQRQLTKTSFARDFLDRVLGLDDELDQMASVLDKYRKLDRNLAGRLQEEAFAAQQLEMWQYQHKEISEAALDLDEEDQLGEKLALGRNARGLMESALKAREALSEGDANARQMLATAGTALQTQAGTSSRLDEVLAMVKDAAAAVEEAAMDLERFTSAVDIDPAQLDSLESRKAEYESLRRKYTLDIPGLLQLQEDLSGKIARQEDSESDLAALRDEVKQAAAAMAECAMSLRQKRKEGHQRVAAEARQLIRPLALPELELGFEIDADIDPSGSIIVGDQPCNISKKGADKIRLLVQPNKGEAAGDVAKIASGGEKSRIYLGFSVMQETGRHHPFWLFDEIDAGLGMDHAVSVAIMLRKLALGGQVVCISHLPTVAAHGDNHVKVFKATVENRTTLAAQTLEGEDRVLEIARLLGGEAGGGQDRETQLAYARELLAQKQ
jgi:DNA repair protein RecN (Recombination protein N)